MILFNSRWNLPNLLVSSFFKAYNNISKDSVRANSVKLPSQPWGVDCNADGSIVVAACYKNLVLFEVSLLEYFILFVPGRKTCY